jgi:hypothetical protein
MDVAGQPACASAALEPIENQMSVSSACAEPLIAQAAVRKDDGLAGFLRKRRYLLYRIAGMVVFLGGWQIASSTGIVNPLYAASSIRSTPVHRGVGAPKLSSFWPMER